jgi:hypothetical protein
MTKKITSLDPASVAKAKEKKYTQQEFVEMYNSLCRQTGWQIAGQPSLKPMNDLGGCLIVAQLGVVQYIEPPKQ